MMSLEAVLELARLARRSPHARRVLHDALLERYGRSYEEFLEHAQYWADDIGRAVIVTLAPAMLAEAETSWDARHAASVSWARKWGQPAPRREPLPFHLLINWSALRMHDAGDLRFERNRSQATEQQIVALRSRFTSDNTMWDEIDEPGPHDEIDGTLDARLHRQRRRR